MKKVFLLLSIVVLLTSCMGNASKEQNDQPTEEPADTTTTVAEMTGNDKQQGKEDITDLPLFAVSDYEKNEWYVPVGFTPSKLLSADEFAALSDDEQDAENKRGEQEIKAFVDMLKQNMSRYTKLLDDGQWRDVEYVESNFDRGDDATIAIGWTGEERKDHMKYVCYRAKDGKKNEFSNYGMLFTKEYAHSHQFLDIQKNGSQMKSDQIKEIERRTGKKVSRQRFCAAIDGKYNFYIVQFENEGKRAYAQQAVVTPDGIALSQMEEADVDEEGKAMWAVDMDGEYPEINICAAETKDGVLKLWYQDYAPEHASLGVYTVKGKDITKREYYQNYVWVN